MAIGQKIRSALGMGSGVDVTEYECVECGNTFESSKDVERAQCMECLSNDVEPA